MLKRHEQDWLAEVRVLEKHLYNLYNHMSDKKEHQLAAITRLAYDGMENVRVLLEELDDGTKEEPHNVYV